MLVLNYFFGTVTYGVNGRLKIVFIYSKFSGG